MNRFFASLLLIASTSAAFAIHPQTGTGNADGTQNGQEYRLVWQDLFDNNELNEYRWNIEVNGNGGGNNELQYYRAENVSVGDDGEGNGCLILTARREEYKGKHFTSGRLNTLHMVTFTHGKIEAAIKLPKTANGLWPAFWMMGDDWSQVGWPRCGETDIMEFGNANGINNGTQDRYFNGACHWGPQWPNASDANSTTRSYSLQDGEFHIFTCIWNENEIRMYVDLDKNPIQTPYYKINIKQDDPNNEWAAGNYFHKPNFIIFDLAVGGDFTGIHDANAITALNNENGQEASMYINYVKIYQLGNDNEELYTIVDGDPESSDVDPTPNPNPEPEPDPTPDPGALTTIEADSPAIEIVDGHIIVDKPCEISVYDLTGRTVRATSGLSLDLSPLGCGFYVVRAGAATLTIQR